MGKLSYIRNDSMHLYNPREEGWTSYDINYTNALRKSREIKYKTKINKNNSKRFET